MSNIRHHSYYRQPRSSSPAPDWPVIDFALPPLHALIIMRSSMTLSLTLLLPLCTMKTSWPRIEVLILTEVSPLLNFLSSQFARLVERRSQMASTRTGCEDPEKILTCRMIEPKRLIGVWKTKRFKTRDYWVIIKYLAPMDQPLHLSQPSRFTLTLIDMANFVQHRFDTPFPCALLCARVPGNV